MVDEADLIIIAVRESLERNKSGDYSPAKHKSAISYIVSSLYFLYISSENFVANLLGGERESSQSDLEKDVEQPNL